jgi:hypothetical protein
MPSGGSFREVGTSGLNRYAGMVTEEEFIPALAGRNALKVFKEMRENDPIVGAFIFAIDNLLRQVEWFVEPASDDPDDIELAEFIDSCRDDMSMSWADTISEILSMIEYGWSFHEIVYKRRNGPQEKDPSRRSKYTDSRIGWRKLPLRSQETLDRWVFGEDGGVEAMVQQAPPDYNEKTIPMEVGLLFRTTTRKNNPEGRSLLRNAYRPWYYKKRIEEIEGVGIERDLAGLPYCEVDPEILLDSATPEQKQLLNAIKDIVTGVRRDSMEGVIFPRMYDDEGNQLYEFKLLSSGGSRQFDIGATIDRKNKEIAMTVLADFILLGHEGVGSYALSSDKTNLFSVALGTFLDIIAEVFNRFAIPRLLEKNGIEVEEMPTLKHGDIENPDLTILGSFLSALAQMGVPLFFDQKSVAWARQVAGMPELNEEEAEQVQTEVPEPTPPTQRGSGSQSEPEEEEEEASEE